MSGLIGKKIGMTSVYSAEGKNIPCTVIEAGPCVVTQIKTLEKDAYEAVQIAYDDKSEKHTSSSLLGHFKKAGTTPKRKMAEFKDMPEVNLGDTLTVDIFSEEDWVDVTGISKGRGFQGVVKRHGFGGVGGQTHGQHNRQRKPGSLGASSYPSRVFPGKRLPGRMGGEQVKVLNLKVLKVIREQSDPRQRVDSGSKRFLFNNREVVMELAVLNTEGKETGRKVVLADSVFGVEANDHAIYLDVKQYLADQRQGTHKSKQRNEVAGSTRKLKRQKGTGGARCGSIKSPLFPGGGRIFGPVPRDYSFKLNKKLKQLARRSALTYKAQAGAIQILEAVRMEAPKTKQVIALTEALKVADKKVLLVLPETNVNLQLSCRNIPSIKPVLAQNVCTYDLMNASAVVMVEGAENVLNVMLA